MIPGTSAKLAGILAYTAGDSWGGLPTITFKGDTALANLSSAAFYIKQKGLSTQSLVELTSPSGGVSIISAVWPWILSISPRELPLKTGVYTSGFRTIDVNGIKLTWFAEDLAAIGGFTNPPPP